MTTFTVEIDKDKHLSALKEFVGNMGLNYQVEDRDGLLYTDEIKNMLDHRYQEYQEGKVELVSSDESQKKIKDLLASKSK